MWNMYSYNHMKPAYFSLKIMLLFTDFFGSRFESGFESRSDSGSETFISVSDRIRPKVSDPYGSGSATLRTILHFSILMKGFFKGFPRRPGWRRVNTSTWQTSTSMPRLYFISFFPFKFCVLFLRMLQADGPADRPEHGDKRGATG